MGSELRTFVELFQERPMRPLRRSQQQAQNVVGLVPTVHGFLVFLSRLEEEHVDGAGV
jgi:hypothetical protein